MNQREALKKAVAEVVARKVGITPAEARQWVETTVVGALDVGNIGYLVYKGPEYWADRVVEDDKTKAAGKSRCWRA